MMRFLFPILAVTALATPALAADDEGEWRFGGDVYLGGNNVTLSGSPVDDFFGAGNKVTASADITGSAHMAGRRVILDSRVGGNFYGAGESVDVAGPVAGNVTALGQDVTVSEPVSGNLRAMGQSVELTAPVAGSAVLGGESMTIDATISGDLALATQEVDWGDHARVLGEVHVYSSDPASIDVPESVAPSDKVFVHEQKEFEGVSGVTVERPGFFTRLRGWLGGVIVVGLLGTLFAAVAPQTISGLRDAALTKPLRTGWIGFLGLSALAGSVVFLAMTGIGLILVPVSIIAAVLLALTGYVLGTYVLGVWATGVAGRAAPKSTGERAIAAFAGAAVAAALGLVPWIGWLAVMAIFLVGAGAVMVRLFAPGFHVSVEAA
jgi:hypothetical protein